MTPHSTPRLGQLRQKHNFPAVRHGFRSTSRDWTAKETNHLREAKAGDRRIRSPQRHEKPGAVV